MKPITKLIILFNLFLSSTISGYSQCKEIQYLPNIENPIGDLVRGCDISNYNFCLNFNGQFKLEKDTTLDLTCSTTKSKFYFCATGLNKIVTCIWKANIRRTGSNELISSIEKRANGVSVSGEWIGEIEMPRYSGQFYFEIIHCGSLFRKSSNITFNIIGSYSPSIFPTCQGQFDGANYFVMDKPNGGFIYENAFYVSRGASACPTGTSYFNSEKCTLMNKPSGGIFYSNANPAYFRVNGQTNHPGFVFVPQYNKSYYYIPNGMTGQEQTYNNKKKWFIQTFNNNSCPPNSVSDSQNCLICKPPCGKMAYEWNGKWWYH